MTLTDKVRALAFQAQLLSATRQWKDFGPIAGGWTSVRKEFSGGLEAACREYSGMLRGMLNDRLYLDWGGKRYSSVEELKAEAKTALEQALFDKKYRQVKDKQICGPIIKIWHETLGSTVS